REAQPEIERRVAEWGLEGQVRFLGYCPADDMPTLYRGAAALVFPSLFEGFGMPVLEAMASGCPVVCGNTTSVPQVAGDAAVLLDPGDHEGWAAAMARLLTVREWAEEWRQRGLRQAARFSWRRHTLQTLGILYRVHRNLSSPLSP